MRRFLSLFLDLETGSGWRLPALDGLRGVAAMMVVVAHANQEFNPGHVPLVGPLVEMGGQGGVMLFFALSGFLLYLPWVRADAEGKAPPSFKAYAARRCLRIMPAYYLQVLIFAAAISIQQQHFVGVARIGMHLLFLPMLTSRFRSFLSVFWTLQVEEFYYWSLPLLHRVFRPSPWLGWLATAAVSGVWAGLAYAFVPDRLLHTALQETPFYLPAFGCGMVAAVMWQRVRKTDRAWMFVVAGAVGYALVAYLVGERPETQQPWLNLLMAPPAACAVFGAACGGADFLAATWMRWIGSVSYSLYLWHPVFISILPVPWPFSLSFPLKLVWVTAASLAWSGLNYLLVERPFLKLRPRTA